MGAAAILGIGVGAGLALIANFALSPKALAEKVGVAAAVRPDAFSSLAGAPKSQLNIGKSIFYNERINTTTSGLVQVLLVDGSTFTVGPGSDLVHRQIHLRPEEGNGPDRRLLLQGRDAFRRRQDFQEGRRRHYRHAGRCTPGPGHTAQKISLFSSSSATT